jgi:alpha-galactosidase
MALVIGFAGLFSPNLFAQTTQSVYLDELDLSTVQQGWASATARKNLRNKPITLGGKVYERGFCTHAPSEAVIILDGKALTFHAVVGVEDINADLAGVKPVIATIIADKKVFYTSSQLVAGKSQATIDLPIKGVKLLELQIEGVGGYSHTHTSWADASITYLGAKPLMVPYPSDDKAEILTPKPGPAPRITGPKVFGVRRGSPILFRFTATGTKPIKFAVKNLPEGLFLDANTGQLTGSITTAATLNLEVRASNTVGTTSRNFRLVVGDEIGLTPAMGWNSWNCWAMTIDEQKVRAAADQLVNTGLADHGWSFVNIDDGWEAADRDSVTGILGTDQIKFKNMKNLADYVHNKGLKLGIYSSPGKWTCGKRLGSLGHEVIDAQTWANWGIDYLKYDKCSFSQAIPVNPPTHYWHQFPYQVMEKALRGTKRDIIYSMCQYGEDKVWKWGPDVGGNSWRTTDDIIDTWASMRNIGFGQRKAMPYTQPGHFNDMDMLVVGQVGWSDKLHPTRLTPSEQYTHISLWCLLSSPLLLGSDLSKLDDFTLGLLTNDEVLDVNQDPEANPAKVIRQSAQEAIYTKTLEDGSLAVGLFNLDYDAKSIKVSLADLGLSGKYIIRDLWRQKDTGTTSKEITCRINRHGVALLSLRKQP